MKLKKVLALLLCAAMILSSMGTMVYADAATLTVGEGGYATLAEAIDAAADGDTINLTAETVVDGIDTAKTLTLTGEKVILANGATVNAENLTASLYAEANATVTVYAPLATLTALGNITISGSNIVKLFDIDVTGLTITIGEGDSLIMSGRPVLGHGCTFHITGNISDAKTADISAITPSLQFNSASITGNGINFVAKDAYIEMGNGATTSKNSSAYGDFDFDFTNCVVNVPAKFAFSTPKNNLDPTFEVSLKDSVMNVLSHLAIAYSKSTVTLDNSNLNVAGSMRNDGVMNIKNGSVLDVDGMIQAGENGGNTGTIMVDDATLDIFCSSTGHAIDGGTTGAIVLKNGAEANIGHITNTEITAESGAELTSTSVANSELTLKDGAEVVSTTIKDTAIATDTKSSLSSDSVTGTSPIMVDTTDLSGGNFLNIGNAASVTVTYDPPIAEDDFVKVDPATGAITITAVAKANGTLYNDLPTALQALTQDTNTLEILQDITISEQWKGKYNGGWMKKSVAIDGNDHTLEFTGLVSDNNYFSVFRFGGEEDKGDPVISASVTDLTFDLSKTTNTSGVLRAISTTSLATDVTITDCHFIGNPNVNSRAIIFGEHAGSAQDPKDVNAIVEDCTFENWRKAISVNENGKNIEAVEVADSTFTNTGVTALCASDSVVFTGNTMVNSWIEVNSMEKAAGEHVASVTVTGNTLAPDTATYQNIIKSGVDITAQEDIITPVATVNGENYFSLKEAFDALANDGDEIKLVDDVVLSEPIVFDGEITFVFDGDGHTISEDAASTKLDVHAFNFGGTGLAYSAERNYTVKNVIFDGFSKPQHVLRLESSDVLVENCDFINMNQAGYLGIVTAQYTNLTVRDCDFIGNKTGECINVNYSSTSANPSTQSATIDNCVFRDNECNVVGVIYHADGSALTVTDCEFTDNEVFTSNGGVIYAGYNPNVTVTGNLFKDNNVDSTSATETRLGALALGGENATVSENVFINNTVTRNGSDAQVTHVCDFSYYEACDLSDNYWNDGTPPELGKDITTYFGDYPYKADTFYTDYTVDAEGNLVFDADDAVDNITQLNINFRETNVPGLYNITLTPQESDRELDIYEFVGAEFTFKNTSKTFALEDMQYDIFGIEGKTNAEKSIQKKDTYALRLVDGAARMCGPEITIGQVQFYGQGNVNFTVESGTAVATKYNTHLGQYYTLDTDADTMDSLNVLTPITDSKVEEAFRDVVVNIAFNHNLRTTDWWGDNQFTVSIKDGFDTVMDYEINPADIVISADGKSGTYTFRNVKLGRLTVTLEAPGYRKYVHSTTLEEGADETDALVLSFWNDVKRTVEVPVEIGKTPMAHNFLAGDIVMDYKVDEYDLAAVTSYYGTYEIPVALADKYIKYDLNRDGAIDIMDVHYVLHTLNN